MPLLGGRAWSAQPFSYKKVCYQLGGGLFVILVLIGETWWDNLAGRGWVVFIGSFGVAGLFVLLSQRLGWRLLARDLRAMLAYDSTEAPKGTIHSYRELFRWMRGPRS